MSYEHVNHVFLYHAYALALGGWVKSGGRVTPIEGIAPSVLSITGGFGSASARCVNTGVRSKYPFGERGPSDFSVYVGHAYTEVRGVETDGEDAYRTTVRSVLDDVRINDVLAVEHAEAILSSTHKKPKDDDTPAPEAEIYIGDSNISGLRVAGKTVTLTRHDTVDKAPSFGAMQSEIAVHKNELLIGAGKSGAADDSLLDELCNSDVPVGTPLFARDLATMDSKANSHLRYSLYKSADVATTPGVRAHKSAIEVDNFGRIFFGEIFASHGTKQVTMFRIDLGCDNCGGMGGSGGSTNGSTYPP